VAIRADVIVLVPLVSDVTKYRKRVDCEAFFSSCIYEILTVINLFPLFYLFFGVATHLM